MCVFLIAIYVDSVTYFLERGQTAGQGAFGADGVSAHSVQAQRPDGTDHQKPPLFTLLCFMVTQNGLKCKFK